MTTYLTDILTHLTKFYTDPCCHNVVPSRILENARSLVIQQWLKGEQRDKIATDSGLSGGAVTNIVSSWKQRLGFAAAEELRELAVTLKKIGITAAQCAVGCRAAIMMNRLGV